MKQISLKFVWGVYLKLRAEAVRERALAKLTKEEREALGLH